MTVTVKWSQENALTGNPKNRVKRTMIEQALREDERVRSWEQRHNYVTIVIRYVAYIVMIMDLLTLVMQYSSTQHKGSRPEAKKVDMNNHVTFTGSWTKRLNSGRTRRTTTKRKHLNLGDDFDARADARLAMIGQGHA